MIDKIQWIKDHRNICVSPATQYNFRILEKKFKVTCCCNLDTSGIKKAADFGAIDTLATDLTQGKTSPLCHVCYADEDKNLMSERMRYLLDLPESSLLQVQQNRPNEFTIGMKFSNLCNSACRSCNEYDSSLWASTFDKTVPGLIQSDLSENPVYWQQILSAIEQKYAELSKNNLFYFYINVIGGETLLQKGFYRLLDWLIDNQMASNVVLRITTGATVTLSNETIDKLLKFKKISFSLSIDTVGDNFQYVRWPAKFSKIETVLDNIISLSKANPLKFEIFITPVFSLNNIFYIQDYMDWWLNWMNTNGPLVIMPINLYQPEYLDLCILPEPYRQKLASLLLSLLEHPLLSLTDSVKLQVHLSMIANTLNNTPGNAEKFIEYLKYTANFDKVTNVFSDTGNKKLFDLLSDADKQIYRDFLQTDIN